MKNLVNSGRYVFQGLECLNDLVATVGCKFFFQERSWPPPLAWQISYLFQNLKTAKIHSNSTMKIHLEP